MSGLSFGVISTFDHNTQEWSGYKARLSQWFIANDVTESEDKAKVKRRAILLSALSESSYRLASNLALPKKLEETEYEDILNLLDAHFTPKRCGFADRHHFYTARQQPGEGHAQWAARVRGLAAHCDFQSLEGALVDKFLMGLEAGHERDKLYALNPRELTLAKAVDLAESVRCARQASKAGPAPFSSCAPPQQQDGGNVFKISNSKSDKCGVCGYANHKSDQCRYKNYKCKKCGQKGHLRRLCATVKVNFMEEGNVDGGDDGKSIFNIRCKNGKPMTQVVSMAGKTLEFEIDSGSAVSVISETTYNTYFSIHPLSLTKKRLISYTGSNIVTIGCVRLDVTYDGVSHWLDVFVVRNGGPSLLGRDFIHIFNLELAPAPSEGVNYLNKIDNNFIQEISHKFPRLFSGSLGCFNKYKVMLHLRKEARPVFFRARPVAFALRDKIDREIDRLLELGIIKEVEYAEYASPVVPVLKKDNSVRLCADYSVTINKQLVVEKYPLPTIEDMFSKLHGGEQFTKLDLSMAYNQLVLAEESQDLTCINTHRGLFKYTRLVFGLSSAPAIFQRAIECVLSGLEGVLVFLDDILITGVDKTQHKDRLMAVLKRLEDAGLTVQKSKCDFFKNEVCYLGHIIDKNGIRKSPEKTKAIKEAQKPTNIKELQSFLGLINYYRNFVQDASSILSPLYNLLHKNCKWEWTKIHDDSFYRIKQLLISDKVLVHFNPSSKLILTVDASPTGLGAVLSQNSKDGFERPISFASRTLTAAEKKYSQIQKEATAIVFGVRRFHQFLYGRSVPFVLRTDHKPLLTIFGPSRGVPEVSANRLQRYAIFLSAYNYTIEYVRSEDNKADYLSRSLFTSVDENRAREESEAVTRDCEERAAYVNFIVDGCLPVTMKDLLRETERDATLVKVKHYILKGWPRKVNDSKLSPYHICRYQLSIENGIVMRGHKVVIPEVMRAQVCDELHSSHFGIVKMKAEARARLWFPGVDDALERRAAACDVCMRLRPAPPHVPLSAWPQPPRAFHRIHVDFLGPCNGQMFLIIVDAFSKWVECYEMTTSYGTKAVIEKLCELISRVGIPNVIVSDNGTSFTSQEFEYFCSLNGIKHMLSPAYHPASNGQAESFVKIVKKGLKNIMVQSTNKKPAKEKILKFLFDYRNSKNSTTGKSPAELVYGHALRSRLDLLKDTTDNVPPPSTDLSHHVKRQQCLQAKYYMGRERKAFQINDLVWITKFTSNQRFTWIKGRVTKKIGNVMYLVHLPDLNKEVTRHIDQMRRCLEEDRVPVNEESPLHDWDPDVVPDHYRDDLSIELPVIEVPAGIQDHTPGHSGAEKLPPTSQEPSALTGFPNIEGEEDTRSDSGAVLLGTATPPSAHGTSDDDTQEGFSTPIASEQIVVPNETEVQPNIVGRSRRERKDVDYRLFF